MNEYKSFDEKSIRSRFWFYFSTLAIFILILLWLLQIVFMNLFYESMKVRETEEIGRTISQHFGTANFERSILTYSFEKSVGIQVYNSEGVLVFPQGTIDIYAQNILLKEEFDKYFLPLIENNLKENTYMQPYSGTNSSSILYISYLGEQVGEKYFLVVISTVDPVDSTAAILKKQLIIISVISLVAAFILSFFLSKRLATPLINMANTAKELGHGNYNIEFEESDYTEINDLANTLNYATGELTKTIEFRKDLIANVSHDLKTPLTVIKSYAEMIRDISGYNEDLRNSHIDVIIQESDYLTNLVNDFLDISKMESEIENVMRESFDLFELTNEVLDRFHLLEIENGYEFEIEKNGNTIIYADKSKIRQVIYNFITNAINYSKDEKKINIFIENTNGVIKFAVEDFGIGIDPDKLDKIWDRFYQVRDNYERQTVGTGLGLYICKAILKVHDFDFGVESILGKGSTFYFLAEEYVDEKSK